MKRSVRILLALFALTSCEEEYKPDLLLYKLGGMGFSIHSDWINFENGRWLHYTLGDTLVVIYSYTGAERLKAIDISHSRQEQGIEQPAPLGEVLHFESFYPTTRNVLDTVSWILESSQGPTPEGFVEEVRINNHSQFYFYIDE